ncbi:zinc ribbon domain-containing protein [Kribbella speibonae]|uniref:Zinc ribbon domain-containing protein n=1 Tax=Kribbella speibonae TaxID=1572660 RepID=A0ABY1ZVU0_9ACTN|nr:zinc ribbon domain-containing protein [Kribbella speibonae]TCC18279.1 zinc ribbon domain-containing protein [Kribbella speibonae]
MKECFSCGAGNRPGATYCGTCGKPLPPVEADVEPAADSPPSDATRYLCAAVQLNSQFADHVVRDILDEEFKAPPASPDVDLVPVILHAIAARKRHLVRDVLLTLLLASAVWGVYSPRYVVVLLALALCWVVVVGETLVATYGVVANDLRPERFDPKALSSNDPEITRRLEQVATARRGNVTVYSAYEPFVGSGVLVKAESFTLNTKRAAEGRDAESFTALEIHDFVKRKLCDLRTGQVALSDRVFVDGRDIRDDRRFLPDRLAVPKAKVDRSLVRSLIVEPEDRARSYLTVQISGWRGQVVVSTFLRFVVTPHGLVYEVTHCVLPPVRDEFQEVDRLLPEPTARQAIRIGGRAVRRTPGHVVRAPFAVVAHLLGPVTAARQRSRQRREIVSSLRFDYGSARSPRETVSDRSFQRYFQQLDGALYIKVIEERMLQAVEQFFEAKGIDTAELTQRQTVIQNNGVLVTTGGSITAGSVAAGTGARATAALRKAAKAARQGVNEATGRN